MKKKNCCDVGKNEEKGENADYQHFLFFFTFFSKALFLRVFKSRDCVVKILNASP